MDADDWDQRYAASALVWSAGPNRTLVDQVGDIPAGRALDLGAGEGRNAIWLAERGWDVTAVDFSPVAVEKGRRLAAVRGVTVRWHVADVARWRSPPLGYDLVLVLYLHLPPAGRRAAHRLAAASVAEGGQMIVIGHDRDNLDYGVGGPQDPEILLVADEVVADLSGTGLRVRTARRVRRPVGDDDAIDCLVRAERPVPGSSAR